MGVLDLLFGVGRGSAFAALSKRASAPLSRKIAAGADGEDLFDDEFQRKLDYLAMVSRRVFSGAMRAK